MVIDDAHLLDAMSARVLAGVVHPSRSVRMAIVVCALPLLLDADARPPLALTDRSQVAVEQFEIRPLTPRAAGALVAQMTGGDISNKALKLVITRAGGNPLYLEQLIRALYVTGVLRAVAGSSDDTDAGQGVRKREALAEVRYEEQVPTTVASAVTRRVTALPPRLQMLVSAAAVLGETFAQEGVMAVLDLSRERVTAGIAELVELDILRPCATCRYAGTRAYRFAHEVIRRVVLGRLRRRRRRELELKVRAYLARAGEEDGAVLALHRGRGGDIHQAAEELADAAERSLSLGDEQSAVELSEEGLQFLEPGGDPEVLRRLYELQERAALSSRDFEAGSGALDGLADLSESSEGEADLLERRSRLSLVVRRFVEAGERANEAEKLWGRLERPAGVARSRLLRAEADEALGDAQDALKRFVAAGAELSAAASPAEFVRLNCGLGRVFAGGGDYQNAEQRFKLAWVQAKSRGDAAGAVGAALGLFEVARMAGDRVRASMYLSEAEQQAFSEEERLFVGVHRATLMAEAGQFDQAVQRFRSVLLAAYPDSEMGCVRSLAALRIAQLCRGGPDRERDYFGSVSQVESFMGTLGRARMTAEIVAPNRLLAVDVAMAHFRSLLGEREEAYALVRHAESRFEAAGSLPFDEPPLLYLAVARVVERAGATTEEVQAVLHNAVAQINAILKRLSAEDRSRYLERWVAVAVRSAGERAGLRLHYAGPEGPLTVA